MKKVSILFVIIVLPVFIYLAVKANQINSWDSWAKGSAQTLLTSRYWARDGFFKHYLLFLPSGYYPNIKFLDEPELRFLSDGIDTGGLIGKRLYYTHYPFGYLVPYGVLAKLGFQDRFWFRILALCFSFGSVFFLYGFIYLMTEKKYWPALIAVFYYITSITFFRYADSLANMPIDDFFKWLILFFSIYAAKSVIEERLKKRLTILIWVLFFLLAISSYDSTLFVFFWLCALSYINNFSPDKRWFKQIFTKINIKKYLLWLSAPFLAFIVQIIQNTWYLGWRDMLFDFWGIFWARNAGAGTVTGIICRLPLILRNAAVALLNFSYFTDMHTRFALPIVILIIYIFYKKKIVSKRLFYLITVLIFAGLAFAFVLPGNGVYGYQGRQLAPALSLLFAIATYELIMAAKARKMQKSYLLLAILLAIIWFFHFKALYGYVKNWPNGAFKIEEVRYWQTLGAITDRNTMILGTKDMFNSGSGFFDDEFYADRLMLPFKDSDTLLQYMNKIDSAISGKGDFLLILPKEDGNRAISAIQKMKIYNFTKESNEGLKNNLIYIRVIHAPK